VIKGACTRRTASSRQAGSRLSPRLYQRDHPLAIAARRRA